MTRSFLSCFARTNQCAVQTHGRVTRATQPNPGIRAEWCEYSRRQVSSEATIRHACATLGVERRYRVDFLTKLLTISARPHAAHFPLHLHPLNPPQLPLSTHEQINVPRPDPFVRPNITPGCEPVIGDKLSGVMGYTLIQWFGWVFWQ